MPRTKENKPNNASSEFPEILYIYRTTIDSYGGNAFIGTRTISGLDRGELVGTYVLKGVSKIQVHEALVAI